MSEHIISQNSNDVFYAYSRGRFWRWDESAHVWKESHLLAQKFGKAKAIEKRLTPEAFLTSDEFIPMDDYELPGRMIAALRDAKPCKAAPVDPVEETGTEAEAEALPAPAVPQNKPLTFIREDKCPAFDYSGLTDQTVEDLHFAEDEYRHGKQMAERGLVHMGNAIAAAHDALCGTVVQQLDNGQFAKKEDTFRAWCCSIGITKSTAYNLLQVSALMDGSSPRQRAILEALPPTLLYAVAKPSAPEELVEKVKNGEITTNKAYQDLLKENQQLRADQVEAMNRAQAAESHLEAARADVEGLKQRVDAAEAREEEAWKMQSRAETRAQDAEKQLEGSRQVAEAAKRRADKWQAEAESLKKQPITAVVDEEEVDKRAGEKAYKMASDMTAELKAKLEQATADNEQDARNAYDGLLLAGRTITNAWQMAKPLFAKLPEDQRDTAANQLVRTLSNIQGEVSRCL